MKLEMNSEGFLAKIRDWFTRQRKTTLLTVFCGRGNVGMVKFLLKLGFDVNRIGSKGKSPLWTVVTSKSLIHEKVEELVHILIENGANLDERYNEDSLLEYAVNMKDLKLIEVLIHNNVDVNHVYEDGKNILWRIVESTNIECDEKLKLIKFLKGANLNINQLDKEGKTVLWQLVKDLSDDNKKLICELVNLGVDIDSRDNDGSSLIIYAIQSKDNILQEFLIENGAKIDIVVDNKSSNLRGYMTEYFLNPSTQEKLIKVGLFFLKKVVNRTDMLGDEEKKWINAAIDIAKVIAKDPGILNKTKSVFGESYRNVALKVVDIFKSNIDKTYKELKQNVVDVTDHVLDNLGEDDSIGDVVIKTVDESLGKVTKVCNKSLKDINTVVINTSNDVINEVIDSLTVDKKDEIFVSRARNVVNGAVFKISSELDDGRHALVKVITKISKGTVKYIAKKLKDEYEKKYASKGKKTYEITSDDKMQLLRTSSSRKYFNNRIRELERFFSNPDKQEKWKSVAIRNIKIIVNQQEGIKLLGKDSRENLRKNIIDFIRTKVLDGGLKNELKKLNGLNKLEIA